MRRFLRSSRYFSFVLVIVVAANMARAGTCSQTGAATWIDGNGLWSQSANWNPAGSPNGATTNVCITDGSSTVTLDTSPTIGNLQIGSGNSLQTNSGTQLSIAGSQIVNSGQIGLSGTLSLTSGNSVVSGGGTVTLSGATVTGSVIRNIDNTFAGTGTIDGSNGMFFNQSSGTVLANASGQTLTITGPSSSHVSDRVKNDGIFGASNGGTLDVQATVDRLFGGGTITADGTGSKVQLTGGASGIDIVNQTLNGVNGGTINATGTVTLANTITINGDFVGNGATIQAGSGTFVNNGQMQLNGGSFSVSTSNPLNNAGQIQLNGSTLALNSSQLQGGGTVLMSGNAIISAESLVITNNLIKGTGIISGGVINSGTIEASGGKLEIDINPGTAASFYNQVGGVMIVDAGSTLVLNNGGSITNNPLVADNPTASPVTLEGGNAKLTGPGLYNFNELIQGAGIIDFPAINTFGVIAGNFQNQTLELTNSQGQMTLLNHNLLEASNGGTLQLNNVAVTQFGSGTMTATGPGSTLQLINGTVINNNSVTVTDGGALTGNGTINGNLINAGGIVHPDPIGANTLTINGNYTQTSSGTLLEEIDGTGLGEYDQLFINGDASLDGTLDITLNGYDPTIGDNFLLMAFNNLSGEFSFLDLPTLDAGEQWFLSYNATGIDLSVVAANTTPTPEPSTLLLLVSGAVVALRFRKNRGA